MKKIISEKSSLMQTSGLRAKLKGLVLDHHSDVAELDIEYFHIREAWALSEDRVKVTCDLDLKSGHCRVVTRIVPFTLPAETETVYRDWTIVIKPTWYGFGYRLLDENGAVAGESSRDWGGTRIRRGERAARGQSPDCGAPAGESSKRLRTKSSAGGKADRA